MGSQVFPVPSAGASYSSQPPASASSVLLDGQLVTASSISTSVTGTGAPFLLYANGAGTTTFTIAGTAYPVTAGSTVGTSAYTGSQSVTVATTTTITGTGAPTPFVSNTMPTAATWFAVAYGNGLFVAVANNTSTSGAYSADGINWTASTMSLSTSFSSIAYGNGTFVALPNSGTTGSYSTNGKTWTSMTIPTAGPYTALTYGNGKFVAIPSGFSTTSIYSANGITWSSASTLPAPFYWFGVAYGNNGVFSAIAIFDGSFAPTSQAAYSTDGINWLSTGMPSTDQWRNVASGLIGATTYFVAVTSSSNAAYSTNGSTYISTTMPSSNVWYGVSYGNGYFVAVASATSIMAYSSNATTWTAGVLPVSTNWRNTKYGNGTFVAMPGTTGGTTAANFAYSKVINPVAYGIYNGATVRA